MHAGRTTAAWSAAGVALACATVLASGAAAQDDTFPIDAFDVAGNTLLPPAAVEAAVYPHMGPGRTAGDVEAARLALEQAYQGRGYQTVVVEVPEQGVTDRVIRIAVTETAVGRLRVTGSRFFSPEDIKRQAPSLAEGQVPNLEKAEREIEAINRTADRQVAPVLKPGRIPGTVDVDLAVTDELPLHGSLEVNNDHAAFTEDLRLNATVRYSNFWQRGHTLFAGYTVAPERREDLEVFQGSYLAPLRGTPWTLQLSGYDSNSRLATLGGTSVLGLGYQLNARAIYDLPQIGGVAHRFTVGADYNNLTLATSLLDEDGVIVPIEAIGVTYVPLIADYSMSLATEQATTGVSLTLAASLRGAADNDDEFLTNRFLGRANYFKLNATLDHVQTLPRGFVGVVQAGAQVADQPLVSREQFAIGGLGSIRGYLQAAALGDAGAYGDFELRSPLVLQSLSRFVEDWRFYAFGDVGQVKLFEPLPEQDSSTTLASVGLGTRFVILGRLSGDLLVAVPLRGAFDTETGDPYGFFTLRTEF